MKSKIYTGNVMHVRHAPVQHRFKLPFYFYAIDLDELELLNKRVRGFGYNHWRPVSIRDTDYLHEHGSIRNQMDELMDCPEVERIVLVTVARYFARVFNPVSFYYGLRADGTPAAIVAEVNNTFGERHLYLLNGGDTFPLECQHDKQFHVSPFNNMEGHYTFNFSAPGETLRIEINLIRNGETILTAALWGEAKELNTATLWRTLAAYPFTALQTMPRILWQATILYLKKKLPIFARPLASSPMTIKAKPVKQG